MNSSLYPNRRLDPRLIIPFTPTQNLQVVEPNTDLATNQIAKHVANFPISNVHCNVVVKPELSHFDECLKDSGAKVRLRYVETF